MVLAIGFWIGSSCSCIGLEYTSKVYIQMWFTVSVINVLFIFSCYTCGTIQIPLNCKHKQRRQGVYWWSGQVVALYEQWGEKVGRNGEYAKTKDMSSHDRQW